MIKPKTFEYAKRPAGALMMDFYPAVGGASRALILFGYGGGFTKGNRDNKMHQPMVTRLRKAGFAVAIPDYRLNTGADDVTEDEALQSTRLANRVERQGWGMARKLFDLRLFTACQDISDALRFCRTAARDWKVASPRIGMLGVSAGGLAGNALCYPPGVWQAALTAPDAMVSLAAPVVHDWRIRPGGPPLWVIHGKRDRIIPSAASEASAHASQKSGANVQVTIPPDAPHIGIDKYVLGTKSDSGAVYFDDIIGFFERHLLEV